MKEHKSAKKFTVSVCESVRTIRELQELIQNQFSQIAGIPQPSISAIEYDRVKLEVERAKL